MATENYLASQALRQNVLSTAIRFAGSDVGTTFANTEAKFKLPPNAVLIRGFLIVLTIDGGASPTYSVGVSGTLGAYGSNLAIGSTGGRALTGVPAKRAEATTLSVTAGTGTITGDGDFLLQLEYIVEGRSNEVFG